MHVPPRFFVFVEGCGGRGKILGNVTLFISALVKFLFFLLGVILLVKSSFFHVWGI